MHDVVVKMDDFQKNNKNIIKNLSQLTSKKFAFLMGGNMIRNFEAVIGLGRKQFKVFIDSDGESSISIFRKDSKSQSENRS